MTRMMRCLVVPKECSAHNSKQSTLSRNLSLLRKSNMIARFAAEFFDPRCPLSGFAVVIHEAEFSPYTGTVSLSLQLKNDIQE